ncbi:MAG: GDP-mannose 4,6-dehydratase [Candidatus Daviesbacteria bacterium]|nr:MAG: GDP-mannose 4,6-dehydratase [Candidatus Daviesbacteria bacterium]
MKNVRCLVTGADGFIGSHLVEELLKQGAKVRALVYYNSEGKWGLLENIKNLKSHKNLEVVLGDINDPHFCERLLEDQEIIFHLAALIAIPYSYIAPSSYFQTNVLGTVNLLEAARKAKVKRFLNTSTSEVYGTALYEPMDENHPQQAQSPYAASKVGSDKAAMSYFLSFGLPVTIVRPFNNFGPRQSARAVIPTIISQILSDKIKKIKLGSLKPVRDYTFARDSAKAMIKIALTDETIGKVFNIGVGKGYSIEEIYQMICKLTNIKKEVITDDERIRPEKSEVWKLICSNKNLVDLTNWQPETTFEEGLRETIDYIRENLDKYKPEIYNI